MSARFQALFLEWSEDRRNESWIQHSQIVFINNGRKQCQSSDRIDPCISTMYPAATQALSKVKSKTGSYFVTCPREVWGSWLWFINFVSKLTYKLSDSLVIKEFSWDSIDPEMKCHVSISCGIGHLIASLIDPDLKK